MIGLIISIAVTSVAYFIINRLIDREVSLKETLTFSMMYGVGMLLWYGFDQFAPAYWKSQLFPRIYLIVLIILWAFFLIAIPWRRRQAGALLLDLGRPKGYQSLGFVTGAIFVLLGAIAIVVVLIGIHIIPGALSSSLFFFSLAALMFYLGLGKLEITEKGILFLTTFIPWRQIESYTWKGRNNTTLKVKLRRRLFQYSRDWQIPAQHKEAADRILRQHLSNEERILTN